MTPTHVRDIHAFVLVAEAGSMTQVARILGESSGAITRRIDRLERETGLLLVHRTTRSIRLTDEGAAYLATARQVIDLLDRASAEAEQRTEALSGSLHIWSSPGFGLNILPRLLADLTTRHPQLHAEVTLSDTQPNFALGIDIAIFPATRQLRDSALIARRIMEWSNIFVASPAYLARCPAPQAATGLADHLILLAGEQARDQVELTLSDKRDKIVLRPTTISSDVNFVRMSCLAGGGIAYMPAFMVADDLAAGRLEQILPDVRSDSYAGNLYVLYRKTHILPPKIAAFLGLLPH